MTSHALEHDRRPRQRRGAKRNGLLQLGWPHFWLLTGVLGMMLSIVVLVIFAQILFD